jgi:uridine kinase
VAERLRELRPVVLCLDAYYEDLSFLPLEQRARSNFDAPEALDWPLLKGHLDALLSWEPIEMPVYDFVTHTRTCSSRAVTPGALIIVEGLFALWDDEVRAVLQTRVFVALDDAACLQRRIERDVRERGRSPESVRAQYDESVRPMAEAHILPTRRYADVVVWGEDPLEHSAAAVLAHLNWRSQRFGAR